ncbi:MAG: muconolactone Delta-isomerase family protein [Actinomycetota bacterium]|nr:muconolactone Delta-isomerase family protein [Actinomycetota bacterium]
MEFLARIEQDISPDMDPIRLAKVKEAERARGEELITAGKLCRIWRVPGRRAGYALYNVDSPEELHEILSSMPLWPWMDIEVTALSAHALDPVREVL